MNLGLPAPDFQATTDTGVQVSLEALKGRWVILYFYPKDGTEGCSIEAARFEQALPALEALGASVVGVSTDNADSHAKFREQCKLSFALIADQDKAISKAYGVLSGLTGLLGVADRQTFLIDPEGRIAHHWRRANPMTHAFEVQRELKGRVQVQA